MQKIIMITNLMLSFYKNVPYERVEKRKKNVIQIQLAAFG